jgi:hypothetical protein
MTNSQLSSERLEGTFDVLIIHGVGNPALGALVRPVSETIKRTMPGRPSDIRVAEFNWNQIVDPAAKNGTIRWNALVDLSASLARTSAVSDGLHTNNFFAHLFRIFSAFSLMCAELGLAATFATLALLTPLVFVLAVVGHEPLSLQLVILGAKFTSWSLFAVACALLFLVLSGFARALIMKCSDPFLVELRRALLFILRPLIMLSFIVFFIPWGRIGSKKWISEIFILCLFTMPALFVVALFFLWLDPNSKLFEVGAAIGKFYGYLFGLCVAVFVLGLFTINMIAPSLKVFLDIFRYIGLVGYRDAIQSRLDAVIRERFNRDGTEKPIYILSHSLGTVIALDSLLSSCEWSPNAQVTLITLGSPLRRFFMRFFPGLYFPTSATKAATSVLARVNFRWINCYRPFDQVGAALGLNDLANCRDVSTNQFTKILDAHPDYWSDDRVAFVLLRALAVTPMRPRDLGVHSVNQKYMTSNDWDVIEKARQKAVNVILRVIGFVFLCSPIVGGVIGGWSSYSRGLKEAAEVHLIDVSGKDTLAAVKHWRTGTPRLGLSEHFHVSYKSFDGEARSRTIVSKSYMPLHQDSYQINFKALFEYVRNNCSDVDSKPHLRINLKYYRQCQREGIRLRYDLSAPDRFILPDFLIKWSWWSAIWILVSSFSAAFLICVFVGLLTFISLVPFVTIMLGVSVFKDR